jgi:uncharacterized protein YjbJ (UPF0337 family)
MRVNPIIIPHLYSISDSMVVCCTINTGHIMNWDSVEGQWKQRRGKAVRHWGNMMNDELAAIAGKYEELVGRLQEKYGIATEEAGKQVSRYRETVEQLKKSNGRLVELQKSMIRKAKADRARIVKPQRKIKSR